DDLTYIFAFALIIGVLTFSFYFPWIFSFNSQAGGFYFNIIWPTAPQQMFMQFGGFFMIVAPMLLVDFWRARRTIHWRGAIMTFLIAFFVIVVLLPWGAAHLYHGLCGDQIGAAGLRGSACQAEQILFGGESPSTNSEFWRSFFTRRAPSYLSEGVILGIIILIGYRLFGRSPGETNKLPYYRSTGFALLVLTAGLVLVVAPDFVYLIDNFGVRINTIFKLYYQGWVFFSVAAAYGVYATLSGLTVLFTRRRELRDREVVLYPPPAEWRLLYIAVVVVVIGMGLVYPLYAGRTRALVETGRLAAEQSREACLAAEDIEEEDCGEPRPISLDGRSTAVSPDEYTVIQCFMDLNPTGNEIVAEAPFNGGYQSTFGRVAMLTGIPNLLGWINHEGQWRGASYDEVTEVQRDANGAVIDSREIQMDRLYRTTDWETAEEVIRRYGIDYVMVGGAERSRYSDTLIALEKFAEHLTPVCQGIDATLYKVNE
ncbi:MAG TPA: DUF2298 domain-containing protein, partial [Aggregatilineales bacterium]|nr:DUF2298 domain-containing protein [Aggregatilineales bacterium]